MGTGYLEVHVTTGGGAFPVPDATVTITNPEGHWIETLFTNASGITQTISLEAPDKENTLDPNETNPYYATYTVEVTPDSRFQPVMIRGVQIFDNQLSLLPVQLVPQIQPTPDNKPIEIVIPPSPYVTTTALSLVQQVETTTIHTAIPSFITVHLGTSHDSGNNIRVPLLDYICNVACCALMPTSPIAEMELQIERIIAFVLHRISDSYYKKQGLWFDVISNAKEDLPFVYGRNLFQSIQEKATEIFCMIPFSQLADVQYLHAHFPNQTAPLTPLSEGMTGKAVQKLQQMLNYIGQRNTAIPQRTLCDGIFDCQTTRTVQLFQTTVHLNPTGTVEITTWYTLYAHFAAYHRQQAQQQKRHLLMMPSRLPTQQLKNGQKGKCVLFLQIVLNCIGIYYPALPIVSEDGIFATETENAVASFQQAFGEPDTGIVTIQTWKMLYHIYYGTQSILSPHETEVLPLYKGMQVAPPQQTWTPGARNTSVAFIQKCLNEIGIAYPIIPKILENGTFDYETQQAIVAFQHTFRQKEDGILSKNTWHSIAKEYNSIEKTTIQAQSTPLNS